MASIFSPPLIPTPASKPRPRSQTMASTSRPNPAASPSFSRTYQQPMGTGSLRRQGQLASSTSSRHGRSRSQGDMTGSTEEIGKGKRRAVFCDVVLDEIDLNEAGECVYPPVAGKFVDSLGTTVRLPESEDRGQTHIRPMTPGKPPRVDLDRVYQSLNELWMTEESYLRKIKSLLEDYAKPLRKYAKDRHTALIPAFEAKHMFINIEELVPISEAFERDLADLVEEMRRDRSRVPSGLGETILKHVERMQPFKQWLANLGASEAIRKDLERRSSEFGDFIERTQICSRETAQTTGGFKEFLAEPHQRISRYRLMIDPIVHHIPQDGEDIEPLQIAVGILSEICDMKVDDETRRAAIFWGLKETIDGFPDSLASHDRQFIDCIDVDETCDIAGRTQTLRCTLFLFSDCLVLAKRPQSGTSGKEHVGLDDVDRLLKSYKSSHLSSSQANLLGSPKKPKRGVLGFRGIVDISTMYPVDFGPSKFGLVFDRSPTAQSERWCNRPARRYTVADTVQPDVRRAEKEVWLNRIGETVLRVKLNQGAKLAKKSRRIWEDGGAVDSTEVYWSIWDRNSWERLQGSQKGKLALHLDEIGNSTVLGRTSEGRPQTVAHAVFLRDGGCRFAVHSNDASSNSSETINIDRIAPAVAAVGSSFGLYAFPTLPSQPQASSRPRSRSRSGLLGGVLDVFGGGGGLRRGNSTTSKGSSAATTSIMTPNLSASTSPRPMSPFASSLSPRPHSTQPILSAKRPITKQSAPDLYRRASNTPEQVDDGSMRRRSAVFDDGIDVEQDQHNTLGSDGRAARNNRSLSLPPPTPQARLAFPSPSPERERTPQAYLSVEQYANESMNADTSFDADSTMDASFDPTSTHHAPMDSVWPPAVEPEAPTTSPIAYRPRVDSTRRRMIGPREMRSPSSAAAMTFNSPQPLPFASQNSPSPKRRSLTTQPPSSQSESTMESAVPSRSFDSLREESPPSESSAPKRSRPLIESPRPTPRKKVAQLGDITSGPRAPSALSQTLFPANRISSASKEKRIPSNSHIKIRSRRVTSNTSTIRGPPTPPKKEEVPDVFSDPAEPLPQPFEGDASTSEDPTSSIARLRAHVNDLRLKLAREAANKENSRIASPTSLSRSPHTRNVFAKSIVGDIVASSPFSSIPDSRSKPHNIDLGVLSKWVRQLDELVNACETTTVPRSSTPEEDVTPGPSVVEVEMLEQERDLLSAELNALKEDNRSLVDRGTLLEKTLEAKESEIAIMKHIYSDLLQESDDQLTEFDELLAGVTYAAQAEPTATGEYIELTNDLQTAIRKRFEVERELREYKREVKKDLEEKVRLERILRENGISY